MFTHRCGVWAPTLSCNRISVTDAAFCCILRFYTLPWDFSPGCGCGGKVMLPRSELKVNLQLLWALLAFVSLFVPSDRGNLLLSLPPHLGAASSWQPFSAPHTSSRDVSVLCRRSSLGCAVIPGSVLLFHSSQMQCWGYSRFASFRVWLEKWLKQKMAVKFVKAVLSEPTW